MPENTNINDLFSIKLTKDWMKKLGGVQDENGDIYVPHLSSSHLRYYLIETKDSVFIQLTKGMYAPMANYRHISTVHLFQNLYFFENLVELNIK